jgi:hypothetical protein
MGTPSFITKFEISGLSAFLGVEHSTDYTECQAFYSVVRIESPHLLHASTEYTECQAFYSVVRIGSPPTLTRKHRV